MQMSVRCMTSTDNMLSPLCQITAVDKPSKHSLSYINSILLNNVYLVQKFSSFYQLYIVQSDFERLDELEKLNGKDISINRYTMLK